jgi:PAS domain S-box-containing protein
MKRDKTGKFINSWDSESKQGVSLSLTKTAWQALEKQARFQGISKSELVERYARSLQSNTGNPVEEQQTNTLSSQARQAVVVEESDRVDTSVLDSRWQSIHTLEATDLVKAYASVEQLLDDLRTKEDELTLIIDAVPVMIAYVDAQQHSRFINRAYQEWFGYSRNEILDRHVREFLGESDYEAIRQYIEAAISGQEVNYESSRTDKNGERRVVNVTYIPHHNEAGLVEGFISLVSDITARKQIEEDLSKSKTLLNALLASSPIGLAFLDRDLRYIHANEALASINGLPLGEHFGRTLWEVLPEWAPQLAPIFQQVMRTKEPLLNQEISGETNPSGILRHSLVSYYPVCLPDGQVLGVGVTSLDITELKRVEQALRESESRFRSVFDSNMSAMGFYHLNGDVPVTNDALLNLLGYTREEFLARGLRWTDFCPPEYAYLDERASEEALELGFCTPYEKEFIRKDGSRVPILVGGGRFAGTSESGVFFAIDLTEYKRAEQAQQYLAEASRVLSSSLDYHTTLGSIARLSVPQLADWCTVHLVEEDGSVQPLATAHVNPAKVVWAEQINQKYPFDPDAPRGAAHVLRTGQSELYPDIPDHLLVEAARDAEHLQILCEVGFRSVMIVPLLARSRTLGTISFISAESGRCYDQADLALAEELARRAALAVDNARLYRQAHQARHRAEQAAARTMRLQAVTAAFSEALTPAQVASVVVNQGIAALGSGAGFVALLLEDDTSLEIVESIGLPQEVIDSWRCFPVTAQLPVAETVRTGQPIFLESAEAFIMQYSILAHVPTITGNRAFACIPLTAEGRTVGGMSFSFPNAMGFSEEDRAFMVTLGQQCAQAIARARLYEAEQRARAVSEAALGAAESANRIKDEFLAVLSHELRSPLNPILGWTKLLRSRKLDEKATDRALETIERNAKLQTQLIEDLLDVSRILQGKLVLNVSSVNLVTTIEAALETVRLAAQAKDIQIQTELDSNVGQVSGDANRLQQVVWNLLSNAVKFTPQGGRVEVRLSVVSGQWSVVSRNGQQTTNQYAQIQVSDTGKGISPEFVPYVFEYFRQENSTTTRQFGGLGLGLAIVRYLTELHGGSVQAESPGEGLGAIFTVRLPLMVADGEAIQDEVQPDCFANLSGLNILVVDDEPDIRELVAFILEQSGAEVTITASAQEALTALNQSVPDVLLSDIGMPEVDGYMLMRKVRALSAERGARLPAIALTAYAGEYNQQQAIAAGFQLHISKPVEPEELVRAIATLVGRI